MNKTEITKLLTIVRELAIRFRKVIALHTACTTPACHAKFAATQDRLREMQARIKKLRNKLPK